MKIKIERERLESVQFLAQSVGSGKTKAAIQGIGLKDDECHVFVSPTKVLAEEIYRRMSDNLVNSPIVNRIKLITGDRTQTNEGVASAILKEIDELPADQAHVLIITTAAFRIILPRLNRWTSSRYHVYLDEGIDAIESNEANIGGLTGKLADHLNIDSETGLTVVKYGCRAKLDLVADGNDGALGDDGDLCHHKIIPIAKMLTGGLFDVFVNVGEKSVRVVGLIKPQNFADFKSVTMIVAMFEQSILAKYWSHRHGIGLENFEHNCELRDTHSEKGPLISIYHVLHEGDNASKTTLQSEYQGKQVIDHVAYIVGRFFEGRDEAYCYAVNNFYKATDKTLDGGARMPVKCEGLNDWRQFTNVAALASCLPPTWVKDMVVKILGEDGAQFYKDWRMANTYQTVGRCSIRTPENTNPITVVVLSKEEATELNKLFPGSTLMGQLGDLPSIKLQKRNDKPVYTNADNKAYSVYVKRIAGKGEMALVKTHWYETVRQPQLALR